MYYVQEEDFEGILTIPRSNGMPGYAQGVEGLIKDFNRSMILENEGRFQGSLHMKIKKHGLLLTGKFAKQAPFQKRISRLTLLSNPQLLQPLEDSHHVEYQAFFPWNQQLPQPMRQYGYACYRFRSRNYPCMTITQR
ncbi:hypothetical protein V6N13_059783 [Hibiscus sabdariffa]